MGSATSFFRNFATESTNVNGNSKIPELIFKINVRILRKYKIHAVKHSATSFFLENVLDLQKKPIDVVSSKMFF